MRYALLLIALILAGSVSALDTPPVYETTIRISGGAVSITNVSVLLGYPCDGAETGLYTATVAGHACAFNFPSEISYGISSECIVNDTSICDSYEEFDDAEAIIYLPYDPYAEELTVSRNGTVLATASLSEFMNYCGDGRCSETETPLLCELDCGVTGEGPQADDPDTISPAGDDVMPAGGEATGSSRNWIALGMLAVAFLAVVIFAIFIIGRKGGSTGQTP